MAWIFSLLLLFLSLKYYTSTALYNMPVQLTVELVLTQLIFFLKQVSYLVHIKF